MKKKKYKTIKIYEDTLYALKSRSLKTNKPLAKIIADLLKAKKSKRRKRK